MLFRRREFLGATLAGATLAGATGTLLAPRPAAAAEENIDPTATVPLGKDLKVCRIGAGTGMNGGYRQSNHIRMGIERLHALLAHEWELGVRLFDCADIYGTHPWVGQFLKGKPRESFQVVSKIWFLPGALPEQERPDADVCVKRFLRELQLPYLDIVQIHCMTDAQWPDKMRKQMDIMEKLKKDGLIRAHGVSVHSLAALKAAAAEPWVDTIHVRINPFKHRTDGPMDEVLPVLKTAKKNGKGLLGMKLCGEGKFNAAEKAESVKFVIGTGLIDVLLAGFEKPEQVDEFKGLVQRELVALAARPAAART